MVSVSSSQLRAGKEKTRQQCCFFLALDGVGMHAHRANCASLKSVIYPELSFSKWEPRTISESQTKFHLDIPDSISMR